MNFEEYAAAFDKVREEFERAVRSYGLPFEEEETQPRSLRAAAVAEHKENGLASLWSGWISPACMACRTGEETATYFVSLECTRRCYFCFNPNQEDYEYFLSHKRDIAVELRQAHAAGANFRHLAVTGGEPCLHKPEVLEFVHCAKELYPGVHVRLYTSGDLLDGAFLAELSRAGLDELRFSVKPDALECQDGKALCEHRADVSGGCAAGFAGLVVAERAGGDSAREAPAAGGREPALFDRMRKAVSCIPDVMVEMPVVPGTLPQMKGLLARLDELGLRGVNLLEFCFPLHNAQEFARRGFRIRKNPYERLYNYWYAGGMPVAGSEAECLELLRFAREAGLRLGVHYCSLDNKFTGQIYQQNKPFLTDSVFAARHAWLSLDPGDYFLKCAKVFGGDAEAVATVLRELARTADTGRAAEGLRPKNPSRSCGLDPSGRSQLRFCLASSSDGPSASCDFCDFDLSVPALAFPLAWAAELQKRMPQVKIGVSVNVLEPADEDASVSPGSLSPTAFRIREVALEEYPEQGQSPA